MSSVVAKRVTDGKDIPVKEFNEGEEPEEFWKLLNGKTEYSNQPYLVEKDIGARLFQCSDATGNFKVFEILNFTQDDLDDDDVMLLDTYHSVFVWIGRRANENEKSQANQTAIDYIRYADDGRSPDCPVYLVEAGNEPPFFTVYFRGWDYNTAKLGYDPYLRKLVQLSKQLSISSDLDKLAKDQQVEDNKQEKKLEETIAEAKEKEKNLVVLDPSSVEHKKDVTTDSGLKVYEYAFLRRGNRDPKVPYPDDVDTDRLEAHLSDKEFLEVFKVSKQEFYKFPRWKQLRVKKEVGLF
eukprot:TRINITY_DN14910_c0_g1_i1.p1 TRINITY_DN14910_c0_g1~~TRINITY_DN14910_c0_g1_i1.p1  ORF type:complete len:321 (+),score=83.44 TRINITY_DN14910_c0_g1_i1:80-964(+)